MSRELPIIFDTESVTAILAGRKTQTRRVIKPFPDVQCIKLHQHGDEWLEARSEHGIPCCRGDVRMRHKSPYRKGDLLWVRETWKFWNWTEDGDPFVKYEADGAVRLCDACGDGDSFAQMERSERIGNIWAKLSERDNYVKHDYRARDNGWRSPLAMFKHFARLWLRVTDVWAERLQDIDVAGLIGEGVFLEIEDDPYYDNLDVAQGVFGAVWDKLNAKKGNPWKDNPWVWVYEFKLERVEQKYR